MLPSNSCSCAKCNRKLDYKNRIKITTWEFTKDPKCSGSTAKTIDGFSLCRKCYKDYSSYNNNFFN